MGIANGQCAKCSWRNFSLPNCKANRFLSKKSGKKSFWCGKNLGWSRKLCPKFIWSSTFLIFSPNRKKVVKSRKDGKKINEESIGEPDYFSLKTGKGCASVWKGLCRTTWCAADWLLNQVLIFEKYWQQIAQSSIIIKYEKRLTFSLDKQNDVIFWTLIFEKYSINICQFSPPLIIMK